MKMPRNFDTLRSRMRKPAPLHESTNVASPPDPPTIAANPSPSKRKRCTSSLSDPHARRTRSRTDSDATVTVPRTTPKATRQHHAVALPEHAKQQSAKLQVPPVFPEVEMAPDLPEIPDEDDQQCQLFGPPFTLDSPTAVNLWPEDDFSEVSDSPEQFVPRLRRTKVFGYRGLHPSPYSRQTSKSRLDVKVVSPYPCTWDLGPDDTFVITLQLKSRSYDLLGFDVGPPEELYMRVASASYPRFQVPESTRAYEASYRRAADHPSRAYYDNKDLCKLKGWRFKDGAWLYDIGWTVTANMFTDKLPTRKFVLQAEMKICNTILRSAEKAIHVTNFTSRRDMGLQPFPERLANEEMF